MKVKKFFKGFMAAALTVTMMVMPVSMVKAAEVTVTSGASTYTFSQEPVAAFEVTGWRNRPIILYVLPVGTTVHSQVGSSEWVNTVYATEVDDNLVRILDDSGLSESKWEGRTYGGADRFSDGSPYLRLDEIYHSDIAGGDAIYAMENRGRENIVYSGGTVYMEHIEWTENGFDITVIPEIFARIGCSAVQIPVADALAMDNANVQIDAANTQAQAAQQAAEAAQVQADAQVAQQAADVQARITAQPSSTAVSQGTYTVEADDNLCKIAQKVYGDMKAWREIYKANSIIKDDYVIYKGQVLVIPIR